MQQTKLAECQLFSKLNTYISQCTLPTTVPYTQREP